MTKEVSLLRLYERVLQGIARGKDSALQERSSAGGQAGTEIGHTYTKQSQSPTVPTDSAAKLSIVGKYDLTKVSPRLLVISNPKSSHSA